jgi:hypothetical protein
MNKDNSLTIRIHINLKDTIDKFIEEFEKAYGIKISLPQATKIIDDKLKDAGGLVV